MSACLTIIYRSFNRVFHSDYSNDRSAHSIKGSDNDENGSNISEKRSMFLWFIVLSMLISLALTTKTALTATTTKAAGAAWFLDIEIVAGLLIVMPPKFLALKLKVYLPPCSIACF